MSLAPAELSATMSLTAPVGAEFTITEYDYDTLEEVGPRTTYRRTAAADVLPEDVLMDVWGKPSGIVAQVVTRGTRTAIRLAHESRGTSYAATEVLNVYVDAVSL